MGEGVLLQIPGALSCARSRFLVTNAFAMALLYVQSWHKTPELLSLNSAVEKLLI
jgi:hypothetical protein